MRRNVAVVASRIRSGVSPRSAATVSATTATCAGSLRLPRCGTGVAPAERRTGCRLVEGTCRYVTALDHAGDLVEIVIRADP